MMAATHSPITYAPIAFWAKIPHGIWLREATSVAVNSKDEVIVFNRGNMPILIFNAAGDLVDKFGNDTPFAGMHSLPPDAEGAKDNYGNALQVWKGCCFTWAHSVRVDHEDNMWFVDVMAHKLHKLDRAGNTLLMLGTGKPCAKQSGGFLNRPTDIAIHRKTGELFITDGYGNSRVHRLTAQGEHVLSWGEPGSDPGQFSLPHNIDFVDDSHVIVCDRENHRVQVFDLEGTFVRQWPVHRATAVKVIGTGAATRIFITEIGPPPVQAGVPNLGHRVSIYTPDGVLLQRLGASLPGEAPEQFLWPHSVAVDSQGSIYVAEVSYVMAGCNEVPAREMVSLRKWSPVSTA